MAMEESTARERFAELAEREEGDVLLAEGALLIAAEVYEDLDVAACLRQLDDLAAEAAPGVDAGDTPLERSSRLLTFLSEECGFVGNQSDYYDPRNSFLNEVLDRRSGIPITLSIVYLEVARRLGLALCGVSFPGHFLLRYEGQGQELYVDPFERGEFLVPGDLPARLSRLVGEGQVQELMKKNGGRLPDSFLAEAAPVEILMRMLTNLREIHLRRQDLQRARNIVALVMAMGPKSREAKESVAALRKIEAVLN